MTRVGGTCIGSPRSAPSTMCLHGTGGERVRMNVNVKWVSEPGAAGNRNPARTAIHVAPAIGTCRSRPSASRDRLSRRARPHHALCSAHAALGTCTRFFSTLISSATATLAWITQRSHTCLVICSRLRPPGPMTTRRLSQSTSRTSYQPALQRQSTPGTADLPAPQRSHRTRHHPPHPPA